MSAPDFDALRLLLRARLRSCAAYAEVMSGETEYVQFENFQFQPPSPASNQLWLREAMTTGDTVLASSGRTKTLGIYWIYVHGPVGEGTRDVDRLVKGIMEAFPPNVSENGVHLYRTTPQAGRLDRVDHNDSLWYVVPVLVYWRLFTDV